MKTQIYTITVCFLFAAAAFAHEVSYEAKICGCFGDVNDTGEVDQADLQQILDCFEGECSYDDGSGFECALDDGCVEDLNHNHEVGEGDLRLLLEHWGPCSVDGDLNGDGQGDGDDVAKVLSDLGRDCRTDLDYSGRVGGNDLAIAEAAWGPGSDHHPGTDIDRNEFLDILDLLAVFEAQGRDCRADIDRDGFVGCRDFDAICGFEEIDCSGVTCSLD